MDGTIVLFSLLSSVAALQMTGPSTYTAIVGSTSYIPCTFTADTLPADVRFFAVFWDFEAMHILSYDNTVTSNNPRYYLDEKRALNGNADLIVFNTSVSDGGTYKCSVTNSPWSMEKEIRVVVTALPKVIISKKVVIVNTKSVLRSEIFGFYPAKIDIKWLQDGKILHNGVVEELQRGSDGTYRVRGSVIIIPTEEDRQKIFSCRVQHESLNTPLQEDFQLVYGAQPLLSILDKRVQRNTKNTLTCMVTGFYPNDITVTWYKDGEILKNQHMEEPHRNHDGTFQVNSTVAITPGDEEQSTTFSCRVQHVSLQDPLQENFQLIYQGLESEASSHIVIFISVVSGVIGVIIIGGIIGYVARKKACKRPCQCCGHTKTKDNAMEDRGRPHDGENEEEGKGLLNANNAIEERGRPHDRKEAQRLKSANNEPPSDPEIKVLEVPELIVGRRAILKCRINGYKVGVHTVTWYVNEESSQQLIQAYPPFKISDVSKDELCTDSHIASLALVPVQELDLQSEFFCVVSSAECKDLKGLIYASVTPGKKNNKLNRKIEEGKDQCSESPTANISVEDNKPQISDQTPIGKQDNETLKETNEEQPTCSVDMEKEDNVNTVLAMDSSSSIPEPGDQEQFTNLENMEAEDLVHPSDAGENPGDWPLNFEKDQKDESLRSETPDAILPGDISSP